MLRPCQLCCKRFASRQSLWNHKKRCQGIGNHSGLVHSTDTSWSRFNRTGKTSGDLVRDSKTLDSTEINSGTTGGDHCVDDTMDASSTAGSDDEEFGDDVSDVEQESMGDRMDAASTDEDRENDIDSFNPFRASCLYKRMKRDMEVYLRNAEKEGRQKNFSGHGMYLNPWGIYEHSIICK